jgi:hypothetical protein
LRAFVVLTGWVRTCDFGDAFGEHDREAAGRADKVRSTFLTARKEIRDDVRDEMPVDMAMHNPRTSVICLESNRNVVRSGANADHIALNGVHVVVVAASSTSNDTEDVTVQVNGVLRSRSDLVRTPRTEVREELTGLPTEPPGIDSSMTLLRGSS